MAEPTVPVMVQYPPELLAALDAFASSNKLSRAAVVRRAVAAYVGFDLTRFEKTKVDPEVRRRAQREKRRERDRKLGELLAAYKRGDKIEDIAHMAQTLGIDLEKEG